MTFLPRRGRGRCREALRVPIGPWRRSTDVRITYKDLVATLLVAAIVVPYLGSLAWGAMPFIQDPRGMAATGLVLGLAAAAVVGRAAFVPEPMHRSALGSGIVALLLGIAACGAAPTRRCWPCSSPPSSSPGLWARSRTRVAGRWPTTPEQVRGARRRAFPATRPSALRRNGGPRGRRPAVSLARTRSVHRAPWRTSRRRSTDDGHHDPADPEPPAGQARRQRPGTRPPSPAMLEGSCRCLRGVNPAIPWPCWARERATGGALRIA
jgi:hypothetical protein